MTLLGFGCAAEPVPLGGGVTVQDVADSLREGLCLRSFECSCRGGAEYVSFAECQAEVEALADGLGRVAQDYELTYDPACIEDLLATVDGLGCSATGSSSSGGCQRPCHFFYGHSGPGEPCEVTRLGFSDCAQGLHCSDGTCFNPCGAQRPGGIGDPCPDMSCQQGAYCDQVDITDPTSELRCFALGELGDPCRGHSQCLGGYCPVGFCAQAPGEGQPCGANRRCAPGLACVGDECGSGSALICSVRVPTVAY